MLNKLLNVRSLSDLTDVLKEGISNSQLAKNQYHLMYEAGLPDIKGVKNMSFVFNGANLTLNFGLLTKIKLTPTDIVEVDIRTQDVDQTANAMQGARIGQMFAGKLGAIGGAAQAAKHRKEDTLHLVINYKGEPRALYFQQSKEFTNLYLKLKDFKTK